MKLYKNSISDEVWYALDQLMDIPELSCFRLIGGTALSLHLGHRISNGIDLHSKTNIHNIDFNKIDNAIKAQFPYVEIVYRESNGRGIVYFIGSDKTEAIKLDLFCADNFIRPAIVQQNIRLATFEDIIATKLENIGRSARKIDFWDIHALLEKFTINQMLDFHQERYYTTFSKSELLKRLIDFTDANDDFEPICLKNKHWQLIKIDIEEAVLNNAR
jgi:hypothetical protein